MAPVPCSNSPPAIHTITGRLAAPISGDHTLRFKQSSPEAIPSGKSTSKGGGYGNWGGFGPNASASRTPPQGSTGCGGRNLCAPKGAAAEEIPLNTYTPLERRPRAHLALRGRGNCLHVHPSF